MRKPSIGERPSHRSHRGSSADKEMKKQKDDSRDQHDVNQAGGNVEREKPKQPKYDQNCSDNPKHVVASCCGARQLVSRAALTSSKSMSLARTL
jgi:hypothetical protein